MNNPFFILSILMSAFFAFFTAAFLVQITIKILRIKNPRVRSFLGLLPFFSLLIDVFFTQYSLAHWINPLSCASCLQRIILDLFFPHIQAHLTQHQISLISHLGASYQHNFFTVLFILFLSTTAVFIMRGLIQMVALSYSLKTIVKNSEKCTRPIKNAELAASLKTKKGSIYSSSDIAIPLATYTNDLILPRKIVTSLTQPEFEAVIAHEWGHVRYFDPLTRFFFHLVSALFWWVPTNYWIKQVTYDQELACDQSVLKYGLPVQSLASALIKVTRQAKIYPTLCYFSSASHTTKERIQILLGLKTMKESHIYGLNFYGVILGMCFLIICAAYL